jgi:RHS repeat-associated protein
MEYSKGATYWTAKDKAGRTYIFGSDQGRVRDPDYPGRIHRWLLEEVRDPNGNYIKYEYDNSPAGEQSYPTKITYTGHNTTDGIFEIDFTKTFNVDYATSSASGFVAKTKYRITEIAASINDSWVRKWELGYGTSTNRDRALLKTITESGRDESAVTTTLPPYQFSYQTSGTTGWEYDDDWTLPEPFSYVSRTAGTYFVELNGDGLPDIIRSFRYTPDVPDTLVKTAYIHNGSGWTATSTWDMTAFGYFIDDGEDKGFRVFDVNGDGRDDVIQGGANAYINNGHGWVQDNSWVAPVSFAETGGGDNGVRIMDVNGDGLNDMLFSNNQVSGKAYLNTGHGWASSTIWWMPPTEFVDAQSRDNGVTTVDVNGDGLPDMIRAIKYPGGSLFNTLYLNNGTGWTTNNLLPGLVDAMFIENFKDYGYRTLDFNGDAETDILRFMSEWPDNYKEAYLDTGRLWDDAVSDWDPPVSFINQAANWADTGARIADIDGDGLQDVVIRYSNGTTEAYINTSDKIDMLETITYPQGGSTNIEYTTAQQYRDGSGNLYNRIPFPVFTVSKVTHNDGLSNSSEWIYEYRNGYYRFDSGFEKKFPGFGLVIKMDPVGNYVKTYFHNGTTSALTQNLGQYDDHISKAGKIYRIEHLNSASTTYDVTINKWDKEGTGAADSYFIKLAQTLNLSYDGDGDHKDKAQSFTYSPYGDVTRKIDWGEVSGSDDGTFGDTGTDKFFTDITYASSTSIRLFVPTRETLYDQSTTTVKDTKFYYDELSYGNMDEGNLTKSEHWKSGGDWIDYEKAYNSYGLVTQDRDPRDKITSYTYDTYNLYPATTTNPLSQTTAYQYDYSLGKPKQVNDANNNALQTVYDGLDRVVTEKDQEHTPPPTLVTRAEYQYTDNTVPTKVRKIDYLSGATSTEAFTFIDGLGRPVETRKQTEYSNIYAVADTTYNKLGLKYRESLPYFGSGTAFASSTSIGSLYSTYLYDPIGRISAIGNSLGTTTNAYDQWKVTITDPNTEVKDVQKDAYDRITSVVDYLATTTVTHSYEYNGNGNLTKITEQGGALRNFTYDGLGRRLTAEDLHDSGDATFGTWSYVYDASGNLGSRTDPKNQIVHYTYDDINRVLSEDFTGESGVEVRYGYDLCTNGKGQLCHVAMTATTTHYGYNLGNLLSIASTSVDGVNYSMEYGYDRQGNPTEIKYPDGVYARYNYNYAGLLDSISAVIANLNYSPLGQVTSINYWNTASTTNTYDATKLYRLVSKITQGNGATLQNLAYTYDAVGNITRIVDSSSTNSAKTIDFTYDDLHRLTVASTSNAVAGNYKQTYTYSPNGNILQKSDMGEYSYYTSSDTGKYANPHAVKTASTTTYYYDNNGNVASTSLGTIYNWDYNNRLASSSALSTSVYGYDHAGARTKQIISGVPTHYMGKYFESNASTTNSFRKYIYGGDTLYATVKTVMYTPTPTPMPSPSPTPYPTSTVYYHHPDHLSSTAVTTNQNSNLEELTDYYPYGSINFDQLSSGFTEEHKFTGQFYDGATGLQFHEARYYDPRIGRFMSVDPVFQAVGNPEEIKKLANVGVERLLMDPQAMNSYNYARSNPIRYSDPEGLWIREFATGQQSWSDLQLEVGQATQQMTQDSMLWNAAVSHPYTTGAATGVIVGTGAVVAGPQLLQIYGYYDTARNVLDFREKLLVSPANYNESEQRMAAGTMYVDVLGRIVSAATPAPARQTYEALRSVLDSLGQVVKELEPAKEESKERQKQDNKNNK